MSFRNSIIKKVLASRLEALDKMRTCGDKMQQTQFDALLQESNKAQYIKRLKINNTSYEQFAKTVPIVAYEEIADEIIKDIEKGGGGISCDKIRWVAKSSGTTNDVSKYIPITKKYLWECHYKGAKDVMTTMLNNYPKTKAYSGKSLTLGGSQDLINHSKGIKAGDLSAILISNTPTIANFMRAPSREVALMKNFDQKVDAICKSCANINITSFAGVPSWNLVLMKRVLEFTGKNNLLEVWPNMSLFMHGGIAFDPYREQYKTLVPSDEMVYLETYNASEGFFALQDTKNINDGMLLMLDYGVFYEFLPIDKLDNHRCAVPLWGVKKGVVYAMIISNNSGLWRYMIGDTVEFTSTNPYRIKIVGRTKQFINAFGEELMVENAENAIAKACNICNAVICEYSVAPVFMEGNNKGAHEWVVEFNVTPENLDQFAQVLDCAIQEVNSDYKAKRTGDVTMNRLQLNVVKKGCFAKWMEARGKSGGQNKVPRLSSNRNHIESLINTNKTI